MSTIYGFNPTITLDRLKHIPEIEVKNVPPHYDIPCLFLTDGDNYVWAYEQEGQVFLERFGTTYSLLILTRISLELGVQWRVENNSADRSDCWHTAHGVLLADEVFNKLAETRSSKQSVQTKRVIMREELQNVISNFKSEYNSDGETERLREEIQRLQQKLNSLSGIEEEVDKFASGLYMAYGDNLTEEVLVQNLHMRFKNGTTPKADRRPRTTKDTMISNSKLVLEVLTKEPMTNGEVQKALEGKLDPSEVRKALATGIANGSVASQGEKRGKRYWLS